MSRGWVGGLLAALVGAGVIAVLVVVAATAGGDTLVLDLDVGDCFLLPDDMSEATIEEVEVVECDQPHEAEVFAVGQLNPDRDQPYPPEAQLFEDVDRRCASVLSGRPDIADRFGVLPVIPNEESWEAYRGRYVCVAIPYGGGSVEGTLGL